VLLSCSNETTLEKQQVVETDRIEIPELNLLLSMEDGRISFDDEVAFLKVVDALKNDPNKDLTTRNSAINTEVNNDLYESRFPKSNIISKYGFYSLYDDFIAAMEEAESYYDRDGGYEEFKEKHPSLFFPETEDDYSAYLPVSDKEIAKLLNVKGEIMIAGKVVNLINVTSYNQLKELGVIPNDDTQWITLKNAQVSSLTDSKEVETRVTTVLPEEFCNNRKLWVNCSYKSSNTVLVEVCFRKKGAFCKWYNYSSTTYLDLMFFEYGRPYIWYGGKEDGCSSHDVKHSRSTSSQRFIASGKVKFQGFGAECGGNWYSFDINMP
jgi:hypothetical protein